MQVTIFHAIKNERSLDADSIYAIKYGVSNSHHKRKGISRMSHQDDFHIRKNIQEFKSILEDAISEEVRSFIRHGNAQLASTWLVSVAMTY